MVDPERISNGLLTLPGRIRRPNFANLIGGQLRRADLLATRHLFRAGALSVPLSTGGSVRVRVSTAPITRCLPFLGNHVGRVVGRRSQEQVCRIRAGRPVTVMADDHPRRDGAVAQHPRNAGRTEHPPRDFDTAAEVSRVADECAHPRPARIRAAGTVHLRPKPFDVVRGKIGAHRKGLSCGAAPPESSHSRGLSVPRILPEKGAIMRNFGPFVTTITPS